MHICLLADNQFVTSEGISTLLSDYGVESIIRVETTGQLQEKLTLHPESLVILDYTLFNFVSMQQMLNLKIAADKSNWLLFSDELSEQFLRYVVASDDTISLVMKQDSEKEIRSALQNTINGIPYICDFAKQILNEKPITEDSIVSLTASERMILHEIALGKTTKEIAYDKNLSFHTVNSHRKNIYRKLGVNNLHEAIRYAIRAGLFDVTDYYI